MKPLLATLPAFLLLSTLAHAGSSPLEAAIADYETGPLRIFTNDGRYGAQGTQYSATEVGQRRNLLQSQRLSLELRFSPRHALVFLYAPLDVTTRVTLQRPLTFRDTTFAEGASVDHRYLFDGYRGSYLFRALERERFILDVGASLQVRNAAVSFTELDSGLFAVEDDIGLVYAFKARAKYITGWGAWAMADLDAISTFGLFGVGGALVDGSLTLGFPLDSRADFFFRLRYVGGGADVPKRDLYNWAHLASATIGLRTDLIQLF